MMITNSTRTNRTPAFRDTPAAPWLPILVIDIRSQIKRRQSQSYKFKKMPKIQILKFCKKLNTGHTFWYCLIRCIYMKWTQPELYALQSGHGIAMRDGRSETNIPPTTSLCGGYNDKFKRIVNTNVLGWFRVTRVKKNICTINDGTFTTVSFATETPRTSTLLGGTRRNLCDVIWPMIALTHCGLVTPHGDMDLGQHSPR